MTPSDRLQLTLSMMSESAAYLLVGTPEQVARKFQRINEQKPNEMKRC
jgi:alkanesulfonate monooxygenase SsuD/methylene tetrahydromethanopterin reductase-like flavin-dependent oxidoreductase (luciferase family)